MKNAIIFGATGYVGAELTKKLLSEGIKVLAIGRKDQTAFYNMLSIEYNKDLKYFQIKDDLESFLDSLLKNIDYKGSVLYYLAWSGINRLTDGGIKEQIKNLNMTSQVLSFASKLGCSKFINAGSQEEAIFRYYIQNNQWRIFKYSSSPVFYAGAKLANADLVRLLSYLQKIDYINTRFSISLDKHLMSPSFVAKSFKKIINQEPIQEIKNKQLCEIILLDELVQAYYEIGLRGRHMADYYLGKGKPDTLENYFIKLHNCLQPNKIKNPVPNNIDKNFLKLFSPSSLTNDIGFIFDKDFTYFAKGIN